MLIQGLKIALRIMLRQRFFTILNLTGLALGSACFLLIYLYVTDELSYDQFHEKKDQLYRVNMTNIWVESNDKFGSTSPAIAEAIKNDLPQVKKAIRIHAPYIFGDQMVSIIDESGEQKSFKESEILASDPDFFELFTFPIIEGDKFSALDQPNSIVITKEYAKKYFQDRSPIGQQITIGTSQNKKTFKVTAVINNIPDQSHFHFDLLVSMNSYQNVVERSNSWIWTAFVTYILLDDNANIEDTNHILANLPAKYVGEEEASSKNWTLELQKITDIRLRSGEISNRIGPIGSQSRVSIFIVVAVLILTLSCINFMNLSTAKFGMRIKETGVKKVLGSSKTQVQQQFFIESLLFSSLAVLLGFGLAELSKPYFNSLAGKNLSLNLFQDQSLIWIMLSMMISIGTLAGSYPAWFMTRFNLIESLKGVQLKVASKFNFRSALVLFQFTASIALIASTLLVKDQLNYLNEKELGFESDDLLVVEHLEWFDDQGKLFQDQVASSGLIENPTWTSEVPPNCWNQDQLTPLNSEKTEALSVTLIMTDAYFTKTLDIPLLEGRNFFTEGNGDLNSIIINEKCAYQMGWIKKNGELESVIGKKVSYYGESEFTVIGIMKDFNFWALHSPVEPLALLHQETPLWRPGGFLVGRLNSDKNINKTISGIESIWNNTNPGVPFNFHFVDQAFDTAFKGQRQFSKVLNVCAVLAVFIAVLGLIGLISFTTEQRTKEFGIRKVLGAKFPDFIKLISYDFLKLLALSVILGSSLSFYFGKHWLENFTYQTSISPAIFLLSSSIIFSLIVAISWLIIGNNNRKNPSLILRDD